MNKKRDILIIEPSDLLYEGILTIILKSDLFIPPKRIKTVSELAKITKRYDTIIVNSSFIQLYQTDFMAFKELQTNAFIVSVFCTFQPHVHESYYNDVIKLQDSHKKIISVLKKRMITKAKAIDKKDSSLLSEREIDVLIKLTQGLSNKEIAEALFISTHTVMSHRKNITHKTGIKSQAGLTIYALSQNIISIDSLS